jgi:hypothetical protein
MKVKLTDHNGYTRRGQCNETRWEVGKSVRATGAGTDLCTDGVLHYYDSPYLAMLMNPIHAGIENPRMFEVEGDQVATDGLKSGAKSLTVIREISPPQPTTEIRVTFAILCTLKVYKDKKFASWARDWLSGKDRSERAAEAAARAAEWAAEWAAAAAARAAVWAAEAAVRAARAAEWAARAAEWAARAAEAADLATKAGGKRINLSEIAEKAFQLGHPGKDASHES